MLPADISRDGRIYGVVFILAGLGLAAFEARSIRDFGNFGIESVLIITFCAVMGPASIVQPGVLWAFSDRKDLPRPVRYLGIALWISMGFLAVGAVRFMQGKL